MLKILKKKKTMTFNRAFCPFISLHDKIGQLLKDRNL